jgi:hypothetical protein
MSTVFISYRRGDSSGHTGRLFDSLEDRFGREAFFHDVESLEYGLDFPAELEKALTGSRAVLVMIGPNWLTAQVNGVRRLDQESDFVRIEVAAALARKDVRTIPVLVGGATMPSSEQLPEPLKALATRNGIEISDSRWDYDLGRLADALARATGLQERQTATRSPTSTQPAEGLAITTGQRASGHGKFVWIAVGAVAAVLALVAIAEIGTESDPTAGEHAEQVDPAASPNEGEQGQHVADPAASPNAQGEQGQHVADPAASPSPASDTVQ